jgi:hypothetical protein
LEAHHGKTCHPVDQRLRTWGLLDAQHLSEETAHPSHGTKTDPSPSKQLQSPPHHVDLVGHDKPLRLGLLLTQPILGLCEGLAGVVSLCSDPLECLVQIPIVALIMASATPFCLCTTQKHLAVKIVNISMT